MRLFSNGYSAEIRPLPIALAHEMAKCKVGRDYARLAVLNRIWDRFNSRERIMCRAELRLCRQGQRGELLAVVS